MSKMWYCKINESQVGPLTPSQVKGLIADGSFTKSDKIRREDSERWRTADTIPGLFEPLPSTAKPPVLRASIQESDLRVDGNKPRPSYLELHLVRLSERITFWLSATSFCLIQVLRFGQNIKEWTPLLLGLVIGMLLAAVASAFGGQLSHKILTEDERLAMGKFAIWQAGILSTGLVAFNFLVVCSFYYVYDTDPVRSGDFVILVGTLKQNIFLQVAGVVVLILAIVASQFIRAAARVRLDEMRAIGN